jgi:hypothetical protein
MNHSEKQLLVVNLFSLSGDDIGNIKKENFNSYKYTLKKLPEYSIDDNGKIKTSEYWLQFIEEGKETHHLFDIVYCSSCIRMEMEEMGIDIFEKFDFKKIFEKAPKINFEQYLIKAPLDFCIIFNVEYINSGEDVEFEIELEGYLDDNFELKKF